MATRLEIAKRKLERLNQECDEAIQDLYAHQRLTNGQPMNDKRNGHRFFKKQEQKEIKIGKLLKEIKEQEKRVAKLERLEERKTEGFNKSGSGLRLTLDNKDRVIQAIENKEFCAATLRRYKKWLNDIEENKEVTNVDLTRLLKEGKVTQWQKRPNVYFVNGIRKTAIYLDKETNELKLHPRYSPMDDDKRKEILEELGLV